MDVNKSSKSSFKTPKMSPSSNNMSAPGKRPASAKTTPSSNKAKNSKKKSKTTKQMVASESPSKKDTKEMERSLLAIGLRLNLYSKKSYDSGDLGKCSSPAISEGVQTLSSIQSYDFELLKSLVRYLIGKNNATITKIRTECKINVKINRHPIKKQFKLCTMKGTQQQIDAAIAIIKEKMPAKTNLKRIDIEVETAKILAAKSKIDSNRLQLQVNFFNFNAFWENEIFDLYFTCIFIYFILI